MLNTSPHVARFGRALLGLVGLGVAGAASIAGAAAQQPEATEFTQRYNATIDAPAGKVWQLLARPGHLEQIHSFLRTDEALRWPGPGSVDRLTYDSGLVFERHFDRWYEGRGYDLSVINVTDPARPVLSRVSFRVTPEGDKRSRVDIALTPVFPDGVTDAQARVAVAGLKRDLDVYFPSLLNGINYYLTTGKPVAQNQFGGSLPPYSAPNAQ